MTPSISDGQFQGLTYGVATCNMAECYDVIASDVTCTTSIAKYRLAGSTTTQWRMALAWRRKMLVGRPAGHAGGLYVNETAREEC